MKKFIAAFVVLVILLAGLSFVVLPMASPWIKDEVVKNLNASGKGRFNIQSLKIQSLYPFRMQLQGLSGKINGLPLEFKLKNASARAYINSWPWQSPLPLYLELQADRPEVRFTLFDKPDEKQKTSTASPPTALPDVIDPNFKLKLKMDITNGDFDIQPFVKTEQFDLSFHSENALDLNTPVRLDIKTFAQALQGPYKGFVPLAVKSNSLTLSPTKLSSERLWVSLSGFQFDFKGLSNLNQGSHNWTGKLS